MSDYVFGKKGISSSEAQSLINVKARPYKVFTALVSQTGTNNLIVDTTLENTFDGVFTFQRVGNGVYKINQTNFLNTLLPSRIFVLPGAVMNTESRVLAVQLFVLSMFDLELNQVTYTHHLLYQYTNGAGSLVQSDLKASQVPIEIRVYP